MAKLWEFFTSSCRLPQRLSVDFGQHVHFEKYLEKTLDDLRGMEDIEEWTPERHKAFVDDCAWGLKGVRRTVWLSGEYSCFFSDIFRALRTTNGRNLGGNHALGHWCFIRPLEDQPAKTHHKTIEGGLNIILLWMALHSANRTMVSVRATSEEAIFNPLAPTDHLEGLFAPCSHGLFAPFSHGLVAPSSQKHMPSA